MMTDREPSNSREVKCYAAALGNCLTVQSKEHWLSQGLFPEKMVTVKGQQWAPEEGKTVSKATLGKRILCDAHNKALSFLDRIGIRFHHALDVSHEHAQRRRLLKRSQIWKKDVYDFDGSQVERWMCKTAVGGLSENTSLSWHLTGGNYLHPPLEILEYIYGLKTLAPPMGMYLVNSSQDLIQNENHAQLIHLTDPETRGYIGGIFSIRQIQFLIYLDTAPIEKSNFFSSTKVLFGDHGEKPLYRPKKLIMAAHAKISGVIDLHWS